MTALAPTPAPTPAPAERLDALEQSARRLHARFGGDVDLDTVRAVVDACHDRLRARATVTSFLVILAERGAATHLARMVGGGAGRAAARRG